MTSLIVARVKSHERQLRTMAHDYHALARSSAIKAGASKATADCNGIALLLLTAADDMEDLQLPELGR